MLVNFIIVVLLLEIYNNMASYFDFAIWSYFRNFVI